MQVKVFFVQETPDNEFLTESLWCTKVGDYFEIDNIPFIAKNVSLGDIIKAEFDSEDNIYYFDDFFSESGNTTIRLIYSEEKKVKKIREDLNNFGCESEVLLQMKIIAINIPKEIEYSLIKKYLENGENKGDWQYEESCLAHEY